MHWILISSSTISHSSTPLPSEAGCYSSYCGSAPGSGWFPTLGHSRGQHPVEDACASQNLIEIWQLHYLKLRKIKIMLKLGFPGRKWFSHLLLFSFWVYWLDPHHISGQGLLLFCQARSSLFRRVNTHPWPARLNEPSSPHVPQKCHCVVSPGPFSLPPFLSQHTVWFLYPLSWRCGKEGGKWER